MGRGQRQLSSSNQRVALQQKPVRANSQTTKLNQLWGMPDSASFLEKRKWFQKQGVYDKNPWIENFLSSKEPCFQEQTWIEALDGFQTKGFSVSIPKQNQLSSKRSNPFRNEQFGWLEVHGEVYHGKELIGDFDFQVCNEVDNKAEIRLAHINLRGTGVNKNHGEQFLGQGFGSDFVQHLEATAADNSIARMSVHAVGSGCYAWARMGFEIDPRHTTVYRFQEKNFASADNFQKEVLATLTNQIKNKVSQSEFLSSTEKETVLNDLTTKSFSSLGELADYGKGYQAESGEKFPIAKRLLVGSEWYGVKFIT